MEKLHTYDEAALLLKNMSSAAIALLGSALAVWVALVVVSITYIYRRVPSVTLPKVSLHKKTIVVEDDRTPVDAQEAQYPNRHETAKSKKANPTQNKSKGSKTAVPAAAHPLLLNTLKGHNDTVTGLSFAASSDHLRLATSCLDQTVRIFKLDDLAAKSFHMIRINLEREQAVGVVFGKSADDVIIAAAGASGGTRLCQYFVSSEHGKQPEMKWQVKEAHGNQFHITSLAAASAAGRPSIVLSCSNFNTNLGLWYASTGKLVEMVNTNQLVNNGMAISPDGRFFAAATFTADVKIWELSWGKGATDTSVKVERVMTLQGHKGAITSVAFNHDSTQVVTCSKDQTWRMWNINVRYQVSEDPKVIREGKCVPFEKGVFYTRMDLSAKGVLAATVGPQERNLHFINTATGELVEDVPLAHDGPITSIVWAPPLKGRAGPELLATSSEDKKVKLWKSPVSI